MMHMTTTETITKYYGFGGKRIAMRVGTTLILHFVQDMRICTATIWAAQAWRRPPAAELNGKRDTNRLAKHDG
jgi:hypothetical protein